MQGRELSTIPQFANVSSRRAAWPRSVAIEMALEQRAIGRRIAELREDRRLTQPVVADRVGVSLRAYQKWEAGNSAPAWRNLEQLAEVFGVSADYLLGAAQENRVSAQEQLDRIEANQRKIVAEIATMRDERAAAEARIATQLRSIARTLGIGAKGSRNRSTG